MNKMDLIEKVAENARLTKKDASVALDVLVEVIADALAHGEDVKLAGLGGFSVKTRASRKGVNPSTGETIEIPASKAVSFKVAKTLKDRLN